jgi:hypothetical protein
MGGDRWGWGWEREEGGGTATCQPPIGAGNVCRVSGHVLVGGDSISAHVISLRL